MRICYLRHASHKNNKLTLIGKIQAHLAIKQIKEENIKLIYCSPSKRCLETAKIIAKKLKLNIFVKKELDERFKISNPTTKEEIEANENYLNYNYKSFNRNIQTCKNYIDKNFKAFEEIVNENIKEDSNVLIVAHSSTLYALNSYICGIPEDGNIKWLRSGNCAKICYEKWL